MNNNIKPLPNGDFIVEPLTEVGKWMDEDKDYKESTLEKQAEFARKRNDPWDQWKASKDIV
jgi:hypothetical protein